MINAFLDPSVMSQGSPSRRSTRKRVPTKKYSSDVFVNVETIDLQDEEERPINLSTESGGGTGDQSDSDFDNELLEQRAQTKPGEDSDPESDDSAEEADGGLPVGVPDDDDVNDDGPVLGSKKRLATNSRDRTDGKPGSRFMRWKSDGKTNARSRGLHGKPGRASLDRILIDYHGDAEFDEASRSVNRFFSNLTFPIVPSNDQDTGFAYPVGFEHGIPSSVEQNARPYYAASKAARRTIVSQTQFMTVVDAAEREDYLPTGQRDLPVRMGPYQNQRQYPLVFTEAKSIDQAFCEDDEQSRSNSSGAPTVVRRKGWVINAGSRILSMSWAPLKSNEYQYLAVAVEHDPPSVSFPQTPFLPGPQLPSSVQIWRFRMGQGRGGANMAFNRPEDARLVHVICCKWGTCRRLKWCPSLPQGRFVKLGKSWENIGRLAGVWTDGCVRALEVSIPLDDPRIFWHYERPLFCGRPPASVCSCVEWLSDTDLAAGCGNGYVAIWNLDDAGQYYEQDQDGSPKNRPYFYEELSVTYILEIASGGPSAPHLLASISVSGHQTLIDLRAPRTEAVPFMRSRVYATAIRYSPHVRGFYTTDDQGDVALLLKRWFFTGKRVLQTRASSAGGAVISTSPLHTSVLVGTPDGIVSCTNPLRKQVDTRQITAWGQKWMVHEWRESKYVANDEIAGRDVGEGVSQNMDLTGQGDESATFAVTDDSTSDARKRPRMEQRDGTVRITEGYKLDKLGGLGRQVSRALQPSIIYDEEQAVTALEWNPNIEFGGWAAAGFGSGFLRIEDVSLHI